MGQVEQQLTECQMFERTGFPVAYVGEDDMILSLLTTQTVLNWQKQTWALRSCLTELKSTSYGSPALFLMFSCQ